MPGIRASKTLLRRQIKLKIGGLNDAEKRRQSEFVYNQLINLPVYKNSKRISIYLSTDNELNTELIIQNIFESNKTCFVPRYSGNVMEMVKLHSMKDWEHLPLTKWKIKQPSLDDNREDAIKTGGLDLIIAPGVAFTEDGYRLGHGKGYYDTYFTRLLKTQKRKPTTIGVAFKQQILDSIPLHEHDVALDSVLFCKD